VNFSRGKYVYIGSESRYRSVNVAERNTTGVPQCSANRHVRLSPHC